VNYINNIFGTTTSLENAVGGWTAFDAKRKWVYFIALKLFGSGNNRCLAEAVNDAESACGLIRSVFRSLLHFSSNDKSFWDHYNERKALIRQFGNPDSEVADYCKMVKSKGEDALYYLTDASKREKNLIFENLAEYSEKIGREQ